MLAYIFIAPTMTVIVFKDERVFILAMLEIMGGLVRAGILTAIPSNLIVKIRKLRENHRFVKRVEMLTF